MNDLSELPRSEFVAGAQAMREMLSRFVEQSGIERDKVIAHSMRLNWNPSWGDDPGAPPEGEFARVEFAKHGLAALREANFDGRFNAAIAEAEKMVETPVLIFRPKKPTLQEQAEMQHDQAAFGGAA